MTHRQKILGGVFVNGPVNSKHGIFFTLFFSRSCHRCYNLCESRVLVSTGENSGRCSPATRVGSSWCCRRKTSVRTTGRSANFTPPIQSADCPRSPRTCRGSTNESVAVFFLNFSHVIVVDERRYCQYINASVGGRCEICSAARSVTNSTRRYCGSCTSCTPR